MDWNILDKLLKTCKSYPQFKLAYVVIRHLDPNKFKFIDAIRILREQYNSMHSSSVYNVFYKAQKTGLISCINPEASNRVKYYKLNI